MKNLIIASSLLLVSGLAFSLDEVVYQQLPAQITCSGPIVKVPEFTITKLNSEFPSVNIPGTVDTIPLATDELLSFWATSDADSDEFGSYEVTFDLEKVIALGKGEVDSVEAEVTYLSTWLMQEKGIEEETVSVTCRL